MVHIARLVVSSVSSVKSVSHGIVLYASPLCPRGGQLNIKYLFNLGKAEGSIDAGRMVKLALARGLQLVGATTHEFTLRVTSSFPCVTDGYRKTIGMHQEKRNSAVAHSSTPHGFIAAIALCSTTPRTVFYTDYCRLL